MPDSLQSLGEFGLIERLHAGVRQRAGVELGIGDDGALLSPLNRPVVTADALVEGVHFRLDWTSARSLGRKAMAVNVSDLAAMAARPVAAFVSLGIPPAFATSQIEELYAGMEDCAGEFNFTVAGGDTVKSPAGLMLSVTLIGDTLPGGPVLRSGAKPGDLLMVSGTLGDSAAGLHLLSNGHPTRSANAEYLLARHHEPSPRLELMAALSALPGQPVHAGLDISDGIEGDARHLAKRSGVKVVLDAEKLPLSRECRELAAEHGLDATDWALTGGEDYELLLAISRGQEARLTAVGDSLGLSLTVVGVCEAGEPKVVVLRDGKRSEPRGGFQHF